MYDEQLTSLPMFGLSYFEIGLTAFLAALILTGVIVIATAKKCNDSTNVCQPEDATKRTIQLVVGSLLLAGGVVGMIVMSIKTIVPNMITYMKAKEQYDALSSDDRKRFDAIDDIIRKISNGESYETVCKEVESLNQMYSTNLKCGVYSDEKRDLDVLLKSLRFDKTRLTESSTSSF